jgi:O-antigen ligase
MINGFSEEAGHWVMWPFFKDHTSYGAILALCIPINIWLIYISENKLFKNLLYFGLIIFFVGLYFSYTRAAWLSILIAAVVFLLYYLKIKFKWIIGLVIIPILFVLINFTEISYLVQKNDAEHTTENFSERIESMSNISSDASNLERLNRWNCALELFYKRPFFGWGPGTYSFVYAPFQSSKNLTIISTNFGDGGNAHSEYLGPLAEQGFIGFLINAVLIAVLFISTGLYYIKCDNSYYKNLTLMIILALTTYFSHGVLNNYLDTDKAAIPVWGLIGIFISITTILNRNPKKAT